MAPNGAVFAAGMAAEPDGLTHAMILASADGGSTWSAPLDDFIYASGDDAYYSAVASDLAGNLYAAGRVDDISYDQYWFTRRSTDGALTWSTVDIVVRPGTGCMANSVAADASGSLYVAGYSDVYGWEVRKGAGGTNFTTVDTGPTSWGWGATAIYAHPTAGIFAGGAGPIGTITDKRGGITTNYGWLVRRSADGGATWSTVDTLTLSSGSKQAVARGIGADALGNLYSVGSADAVTGTGAKQTVCSHWIVRKSANGGASWSTVDNYQLSSAYSSQALRCSRSPCMKAKNTFCNRYAWEQRAILSRKRLQQIFVWRCAQQHAEEHFSIQA